VVVIHLLLNSYPTLLNYDLHLTGILILMMLTLISLTEMGGLRKVAEAVNAFLPPPLDGFFFLSSADGTTDYFFASSTKGTKAFRKREISTISNQRRNITTSIYLSRNKRLGRQARHSF